MKTICLILATIFIVPFTHASSNDSVVNINAKSNEIGLILNPLGIVLLGVQPSGQRIGVSFKKLLKSPQVYFTTGLYYQGFSNNIDKDKQLTLEVKGTSRNIQYSIESNNKLFLSFGAEKRWTVSQCPAIVTYLGFEVLMSYGIENSSTGSQWMKSDSLQGVELNYQPMLAVSDFNQTKRVTRTSFGGGVQCNAGVQLHLNKRFYLFAQVAPTMLFTSGSRVENNLVAQTTTQFRTSQFDFDIRALVSDVGLFYKF